MKVIYSILLLVLTVQISVAQNIWEFTSVKPAAQNADFVFPDDTHQFQYLVEQGDAMISGGGSANDLFDFTGYVPFDASTSNTITVNSDSEKGYLSINNENLGPTDAGLFVLDITLNNTTTPTNPFWEVTDSEIVDFTAVGTTTRNCSGGVTPWGTILTAEEPLTGDNLPNHGWIVEVDPVNKQPIAKRWGIGQFSHENAVVHPNSNNQVVYSGCDCGGDGFVVKFVADNPMDLSSGQLYVLSVQSGATSGEWIAIDTPDGPVNLPGVFNGGQTTQDVATARLAEGFTGFNGVEDVEVEDVNISGDSWIYFTAKGDHAIYRFKEGGVDPVTSLTVTDFEVYAGSRSAFDGGSAEYAVYDIEHADSGDGVTSTPLEWGDNDNLTIDNAGNLWIFMDGGSENEIVMIEKGHINTPQDHKVKLFAISPAGSEPTGMTFTPDNKYMFLSIQHPSSGNNSSQQMDAQGMMRSFDQDVAIAISLQPTSSSVPLTLLNWSGKVVDNQIALTWTTANEINIKDFTIQRQSEQGWSNIGQVNSRGGIQSEEYTFIDKNPINGVNYYRMVYTETTGKKVPTNLIMIRVNNPINEVVLFPSPVKNTLQVSFPTPFNQPQGLAVHNTNGQVVKTVYLAANATSIEMDVSQLVPGVYYLHTGTGHVKQFVVVK